MRWNLVLALLILAGWTIGEEEIKIVFTGDIFGYYEGLYEESEAPFTQPPLGKNSSGAEIGGLARLKKILSSLPPDKTILVDGGGFLVGNAFWSSQLNGSSIASILTNTSYDLVVQTKLFAVCASKSAALELIGFARRRS
ncbi:unnamed protein product [Darwinula stevensoni]|uniref:Uncharacterized protein n=1 Tax=Darwinula stevensoni TaxID=69355 RepID=A0A7R9A6M6_9CRUS|nr:unnamed protein product [Darwinula stevensoni]CAG0888284.1 unnamed protein product [Darwinula stevensoni]